MSNPSKYTVVWPKWRSKSLFNVRKVKIGYALFVDFSPIIDFKKKSIAISANAFLFSFFLPQIIYTYTRYKAKHQIFCLFVYKH